MRGDSGEEAAMLLSAYQRAAQRDAAALRQRRRTIRTLVGVFSAVAIFVGCIAAVDVFAVNGGSGTDTITLEVTTTGAFDDDEAMAMASQFGWSSIGNGWCSIKSSTWCMFSKDKQACKESINCYKNREQAGNGGSGSGSYANATTVGDDSGWSDDEVEKPVYNPSADEENDEDGEKEESDDESPEKGTEAPEEEEGSDAEENGGEDEHGSDEEPQRGGED